MMSICKIKAFILLILIAFQGKISGNLIKDVHPLNKLLISLVFSIFNFEISVKFFIVE